MAQSRAAKKDAPTTDIVQSSVFTEDALRSATSLADFIALTEQQHGQIVDATTEIGDGFTLTEDLSPFKGVPVVLMEWTFRDGNFGEYVSIRFVAQHPQLGLFRGIYNDGSTGICKQLREYTDRTNKFGGLASKGGFRVSEYDHPEFGPSKTWYLAA